MTLWEIGKFREGWVSANTSKDSGKPEITEEEFERLMAVEITESEEEVSPDAFFESMKARQ